MDIIVRGHVNEGKSSIAYLIAEALHKAGFTTTVSDEALNMSWYHPDEQEKRLIAIKAKGLEVKIKVEQKRRHEP